MDEFDPPRVIIRFHTNVEVSDDPAVVLEKSDPPRWRRLVEENGDVTLRPVFTALDPQRLRELQEQAARRDPSYRPESLDRFFYIDVPEARDLESVAKQLRQWATVRSVDIEVVGPDPLVNAADDPRNTNQDYLDAAPTGINARYAWTFTGGDGAGQRIVDLERGWTFNHEDLAAHGITLINGAVLDTSRPHGTSVFGEMIAVDNTVGCVGIVPNVASALATSYNTSSIPNAIMAAITQMDFGDVLLLEVQVNVATSGDPQYGPVETIDANYEAIRLATALGMVVVEAGGNGTNNGGTPAVNLDTYQNSAGKKILWRSVGNADFRDSGAIIVAAASSVAPHTRLAYSTYGTRIDCYGWGENVDTLSSTSAGSTANYTGFFSGTSSASPIVAGAALAVQGICQANQQFRLSPRQMRAILSDPTLNTPPAASEVTAMGVLPNLRAIIDTQLDVTPDVYVRDNVADTGDSHTGFISASPDVILRPAPVANPQAAFGEGSGTELSDTLGFEAEFGQDNVIYVRVRNQGSTTAGSTTATVYWSPPSTLVTPNLWTLVGTVTLPSVPIGEVLTVSAPLTWSSAKIPAQGHYCLVAILSTAGDPGPAPTDFLNWTNFQTFIRENNNVTWRNFNVVDSNPSPEADPAGYVALPFVVAGAPDEAREFAIELVNRVPGDADVLLELPLRFARDFKADLQIEKVDEKKDLAIARLASGGRVRFGPALIGAGAVNQLRFLVRLADPDQRGRIMARQLSGKDEVGRVSWILAPGVRDRMKLAAEGNPIGALG
ncbi:MAG: S8 family peptidase [Pseudonocardiaceae bacterium]